MRISFTVHPDGTSGFDLQTDSGDHPVMIEMGFKQFDYMVKSFGEVNDEQSRVPAGNGLPQAARSSLGSAEGDAVRP